MPRKQYKWWQMRRVRLTRQYGAGIIAGMGSGLVIASMLPPQASYWIILRVVAFPLIAIGAFVAMNDQEKDDRAVE